MLDVCFDFSNVLVQTRRDRQVSKLKGLQRPWALTSYPWPYSRIEMQATDLIVLNLKAPDHFGLPKYFR